MKKIAKSYEEIGDIFTYVSDIKYYLPYLPTEYYYNITEIYENIKKFRENCMSEINTPLIALKNYTEHKCSWERAGMMCDLHIFGLRKFCEDNDVDWRCLRIDEYYDIKGEEGLLEIKKNWEKLDPQHEFQPIKYEGDSLFTKYPMLKEVSKTEYSYNDANENYIKYKAKMLISEYSCEFYKTLHYLVKHNPELEEEYNFYKNHYINKTLSEMADGIEIADEDDLMFLEHTLDICKLFLKDAKSCNDFENVLNSFYHLDGILEKGYYEYIINQDKKPTQKSCDAFMDMLRNIPEGD